MRRVFDRLAATSLSAVGPASASPAYSLLRLPVSTHVSYFSSDNRGDRKGRFTDGSTDLRALKQRHLSPDEQILSDIQRRIWQNSGKAKHRSYGGIKSLRTAPSSRELSVRNANLRYSMASALAKQQAMGPNAMASTPAHVSIEVLSNGTTHMRPCVIIRTALKTYLFNCPEGTSRFLPQLRLKSQNVHDIFLTRGTWDNISGISSIMLSKEQNALPTRLHGALSVKNFLECIRPFQDSDFGSCKYPSQVEECPYTQLSSYEDMALRVDYIPLSAPLFGDDKQNKLTVDVAYLVRLKAAARRIDPHRLISMRVPKGPLIGKLKNGESITLEDGRTIHPDDVLADDTPAGERGSVLVVEVAGEAQLDALIEHSLIVQMADSVSAAPSYVVHLTSDDVLRSEKYQRWCESLGPNCQHIVVNGSGPVIPCVESIYKNQRLLRTVQPALFPDLQPAGWTGRVTQEKDLCVTSGQWHRAAPLQRFWMRAKGNSGEEPILFDLLPPQLDEDTAKKREEMRQHMEKETAAVGDGAPWPRVSFLGTSSAVPSKYRNVSGYLVETSPDSCFLVDVGEGSYGQMRTIFGDEQMEKTLLSLHAVFITHAHQDHMNGLYTVIERRRDAFLKSGVEYVPLVLICNQNVMKPLRTFSLLFSDLESVIEVLDISSSCLSFNRSDKDRRRSPSPVSSVPRTAASSVMELVDAMPASFSADKWHLQSAKAVQVHHTRMANGYVFNCDGKVLVFSGDTKPCNLLAEVGKGADLLVHEATFEDGCERDAERKKHSTMGQAVDVGRRMQAKHLILTHFSARYPKVPALPSYLDEAGNVSVACDNLQIRFDQLPLLPKMIPAYREIYAEELFEIELRKEQRILREAEEAETGVKRGAGGKWKRPMDGEDKWVEEKRGRTQQWERKSGKGQKQGKATSPTRKVTTT